MLIEGEKLAAKVRVKGSFSAEDILYVNGYSSRNIRQVTSRSLRVGREATVLIYREAQKLAPCFNRFCLLF